MISNRRGYIPYDTLHAQKWWKHNTYEIRNNCEFHGVKIPAGYKFDGATIPEWLSILGLAGSSMSLAFDLWSLAIVFGFINLIPVIFPRDGKYMSAALVHDLMLDSGDYPRVICDQKFKRNLKEIGVDRWRRWLMYAGVRMFSMVKTGSLSK